MSCTLQANGRFGNSLWHPADADLLKRWSARGGRGQCTWDICRLPTGEQGAQSLQGPCLRRWWLSIFCLIVISVCRKYLCYSSLCCPLSDPEGTHYFGVQCARSISVGRGHLRGSMGYLLGSVGCYSGLVSQLFGRLCQPLLQLLNLNVVALALSLLTTGTLCSSCIATYGARRSRPLSLLRLLGLPPLLQLAEGLDKRLAGRDCQSWGVRLPPSKWRGQLSRWRTEAGLCKPPARHGLLCRLAFSRGSWGRRFGLAVYAVLRSKHHVVQQLHRIRDRAHCSERRKRHGIGQSHRFILALGLRIRRRDR
mmetsp:Transcript_847/g.2359  ORF Transcript_847/g.2359 Transcript_847/m.2359 type:complete len:309 (-) Transcript_847:197-1123(-)